MKHLNEDRKGHKYTVVYYDGNAAAKGKDFVITKKFTASDDFHAYAKIFVLVYDYVYSYDFSHLDLDDEEDFEKCLQKICDYEDDDMIDIDWFIYFFENVEVGGDSRIYNVRRDGKLINEFFEFNEFDGWY